MRLFKLKTLKKLVFWADYGRTILGQNLAPTSSLIPISPVSPSWEGLGVGWEGLGVGCLLSPTATKRFFQQTLIIFQQVQILI